MLDWTVIVEVTCLSTLTTGNQQSLDLALMSKCSASGLTEPY
jgi:hypothetical protein